MPAEEIITLYTREEPDRPIACGRSAYYEQDFGTYRDQYPALVDIFLFNAHGDLLLQKRGRAKKFNPGALHTTIGGHVSWGEDPAFSVVHECMEELGAPALVFSKERYDQAFEKLSPYARKAALICEAGSFYRNYSDDPIEGRRTIKDRIWLYFGRYDGPVEIPDRSSSGYEWMDLATLKQEFASHPDAFTDGIRLYVEEHGEAMETFVNTYCHE